jgi:hypothetical protein
MWGRPKIAGRILCLKYVIKLSSIERSLAVAGDVIGHQLIVQCKDQRLKIPAVTMTLR